MYTIAKEEIKLSGLISEGSKMMSGELEDIGDSTESEKKREMCKF